MRVYLSLYDERSLFHPLRSRIRKHTKLTVKYDEPPDYCNRYISIRTMRSNLSEQTENIHRISGFVRKEFDIYTCIHIYVHILCICGFFSSHVDGGGLSFVIHIEMVRMVRNMGAELTDKWRGFPCVCVYYVRVWSMRTQRNSQRKIVWSAVRWNTDVCGAADWIWGFESDVCGESGCGGIFTRGHRTHFLIHEDTI